MTSTPTRRVHEPTVRGASLSPPWGPPKDSVARIHLKTSIAPNLRDVDGSITLSMEAAGEIWQEGGL